MSIISQSVLHDSHSDNDIPNSYLYIAAVYVLHIGNFEPGSLSL